MDIKTAAIAAHEYFGNLKEAGFSHKDALYLTACMLSGGPKEVNE